MILVQAQNVARTFGATVLYENVNFSIQDRDRIALVGRNGTGKSTLIQQMMGMEPINQGDFTFAKGIKIGYLEQHVAIDSELTIWQEMMSVFTDTLRLREEAEAAAILVAELASQAHTQEYEDALHRYDQLQEALQQKNAYQIESDIRTVLHGFRFYEEDYDTPVQSLSGGQKTRLALAQILLMDHDLLILDEPTNHLDMETLAWLEGYLANYRGALFIVSHDRYFLNKIATKVIELRHETAHIYPGNYDFYLKERALRIQQEQDAYDKQQTEIAKLEEFVRRNIVRASTTKRAQSRRKQLERMDRIPKPRSLDQVPRIQFSAARPTGDRVIEAVDVSVGYTQTIAEHINFDLRRQQAIAVVGPNGIGKTTLLRTVIDEIPALAGEILFGSNVDLGYYDQNVNHLDPNLTVLETLWRAHDTTDEWVIRSILGSFLFSGEAVEKKVSLLSGGEKARLALALLATQHDNTLLLDEPTNHLDIDSKEILEEALIEFDGTLMFVSHDRYFINRIATQVLELTPTGSTLYLGDYDYYVAKKAELEAMQLTPETPKVAEAPASTAALSYEAQKERQRIIRRLEQTVDRLQERVDAIEIELEALTQQMVEANETNDFTLLQSLHADQMALENEQMEALEAWEEASHELEAQLKDS